MTKTSVGNTIITSLTGEPMQLTDDDVLNYIGNLTSEQYRKLEIQMGKKRWCEVYNLPEVMYWPIFAPIASKRKGDIWEDMYRNNCVSLGDRSDAWHDATLSQELVDKYSLHGTKVEIKYSAITVPDSGNDIDERGYALEAGERRKIIESSEDGSFKGGSGGSFQQVHPANADYGLFSAVHANGAFHYWVPYHLISREAGKEKNETGKIPLSSQHDGGTVEGQINRTKRFHELFFLDATIGTPFITDLGRFDLSKYENLVY